MHTEMIDTHPTDGVLAIEFDLMQEKNGVYGFEETKKSLLLLNQVPSESYPLLYLGPSKGIDPCSNSLLAQKRNLTLYLNFIPQITNSE